MKFIKNFLHALGIYDTPELVLKDKLQTAKQNIKVEYCNNTVVITICGLIVFSVIPNEMQKRACTDIYLEEVDELINNLWKEYTNK